MGGSAASETVLFITSIIVASMVAGVMTTVVLSVGDGVKTRGNDMNHDLLVHFTILNDPTAMPYDNSTGILDLYVRNSGRVTLQVNSTFVLLNGSNPYVPSLVASPGKFTHGLVPAQAKDWVPDTVLVMRIWVDPDLEPMRDYRLTLIVEDASAKIEFRV
jgi:archaellum component FlaG (FlaF/FlaG flagellin family)